MVESQVEKVVILRCFSFIFCLKNNKTKFKVLPAFKVRTNFFCKYRPICFFFISFVRGWTQIDHFLKGYPCIYQNYSKNWNHIWWQKYVVQWEDCVQQKDSQQWWEASVKMHLPVLSRVSIRDLALLDRQVSFETVRKMTILDHFTPL